MVVLFWISFQNFPGDYFKNLNPRFPLEHYGTKCTALLYVRTYVVKHNFTMHIIFSFLSESSPYIVYTCYQQQPASNGTIQRQHLALRHLLFVSYSTWYSNSTTPTSRPTRNLAAAAAVGAGNDGSSSPSWSRRRRDSVVVHSSSASATR
jgi:hypothetical protein